MATFFSALLDRLNDSWNSAFFPLNTDAFLNRLAVEISNAVNSSGIQLTTDALRSTPVPAVMTAMITSGYTTANDGGGARFSRGPLPSWSSIDVDRRIHFPDPVYPDLYWYLDQPRAAPEVAGAIGVLRGDPTTCSGVQINVLCDYFNARGGGTLDLTTGMSYGLYTVAATIEQNVQVEGLWPGGDRRPGANSPPDWTGATGLVFPSLVVDTGVLAQGLIVRPNTRIENVAMRRRGLTRSPSATGGTLAQCQQWNQDTIKGMAGTAMLLGTGGGALRGNDILIRNVFILGFSIGVLGANVPRTRLENITGDCNSLIRVDAAGDTVAVITAKQFSFLNTNSGGETVVRKVTGLANNGGKVALTLASTHQTAITAWADNGGFARVDLADQYQWHVQVGTSVTIAGLTGGAAGLNGVYTVRSINNGEKTRITLSLAWNSVLTGQTGTFTTAAPDVSYLRAADRIYLSAWVGADPLVWSGDTVSTVGGIGVLNSKARFIQTVDSSTQVTLTLNWDAALAGATCDLVIANGFRDGIAFNLAGADGFDAVGLFSKGPTIGVYANAQNLQVAQFSYEPGAIGEGPIDYAGTVPTWIGPLASRGRFVGGSWKSGGRTIVCEYAASEGYHIDHVQLDGGVIYTVDCKDGKLFFNSCVVYNSAPKVNFGVDITPANEGVFVIGGRWSAPTLTVDTGSVQDPNRLYHAYTDESGGELSVRGALRLKRRRSNYGAGIELFGTSETQIYAITLGDDDVDVGDLATLAISPNLTNNPDGNFIFGPVKNRTVPLEVTWYGTRALGGAVNGDILVRHLAKARNNADQIRTFGRLQFTAKDVTATAEKGSIQLMTATGNAQFTRFSIDEAEAVFSVPLVRGVIFPGPYANDAAAQAGGVALNEAYRQTGGAVVWRQV